MRPAFLILTILLSLALGSASAGRAPANATPKTVGTEACKDSLKAYFQTSDGNAARQKVLNLQGKLTLNRLAWAYLKNAKQDEKLAGFETVIENLLEEKQLERQSDPEFSRAVENFEKAPLSRKALAEIIPQIQNILTADAEEKNGNYILNGTDTKLLHILSQHEGTYYGMSSNVMSKNSILNFAKIVNASYGEKKATASFINTNLASLAATIQQTLRELNAILESLPVAEVCVEPLKALDEVCNAEDLPRQTTLDSLLDLSVEDLATDFSKYKGLQYGDLWLKVRPGRVEQAVKKQAVQKREQDASIPDFFKDPVHVIVHDREGRDRKTFEGWNPDFLDAWAKAIFENKTAFLVSGHIHDRKTGKVMSSVQLDKELPGFKEKWGKPLVIESAVAQLNREKSFVKDGKLYRSDFRTPMNPARVIVDESKYQYGVAHKPEDFAGMDADYLAERANAMLRKQTSFYLSGVEYDAKSGRKMDSSLRGASIAQSPQDYVAYEKERRKMAQVSDIDLIRRFHKEQGPALTCPQYAVINKETARLEVYKNSGEKILDLEILIGKKVSDEKLRFLTYPEKTSNESTGAGIYTLGDLRTGKNYYDRVFNNNLFSLLDQKGNEDVLAIHQVPLSRQDRHKLFDGDPSNNRVTGGCPNLLPADFKKFRAAMAAGTNCKVYVLPEEAGNVFALKNGAINFTTTNKKALGELDDYLFYTARPVLPIEIKIVNTAGNTQAAQEFVRTLQDEKAPMMKAFDLDNDDYNDLALLAYGIMGQESDFGKSLRLWMKETLPIETSVAKCVKQTYEKIFEGSNRPYDCQNLSKGYTQIKQVPEKAIAYDPSITKESLMTSPRNAAVATMAYLADALVQIKAIERKNRESGTGVQMTRENRVDFLAYLYQGMRRRLFLPEGDKMRADPETNRYARNVKTYMGYLQVTQKMN